MKSDETVRPHGARKSARVFGAALAAVTAMLLAGCGSDAGSAPAPAAAQQQPNSALPVADTFGRVENAATDPSPQMPTEGEVLHPKKDLAVYKEIDGEQVATLPQKQLESPTWVPVVARQGDWAQILLASRPNGAAGWINTAGEAVESAKNDNEVNVDLADFSLEIRRGGEQVGSWKIGTGSEQHKTPTGRAYIAASIAETVNTYSPVVLPLSSHSDSHETFGGGPGTVGIHTWPDESFVGKANSDGCIRVTKEALDQLVKLPLGTIVNIT